MTTELAIIKQQVKPDGSLVETAYYPAVEGDIVWTTQRQGAPGELKFSVLYDSTLRIEEGNIVRLVVDKKPVFFGFLFDIGKSKGRQVKLTAYDQLRYFKNKDTKIFENDTLSTVIWKLAEDFNLRTEQKNLTDTKYVIKSLVQENTELFGMVQEAHGLTMENTKEMYVLFDDFGSLTLRNIGEMQVPILITEETAQDYDFSSSINQETYNKVKLTYDNEEAGTRDVFVEQHGENINRWGILQFFDTLQEGENGAAKAQALLQLYNQKRKNLSIKGAFGDVRVRAGCLLPALLDVGFAKVNHMMLVEQCSHTFSHEKHTMNLTLRGGEFNA